MKYLIFISVFVLSLVSCSKNEYKVNCTFNHFDTKAKKTYKSDPVDLFVLANNSNELKAAIKETLSNEYLLYSVDSININNFEIKQNNKDKIINENTIYFNISDINEIYSYLNSFKKTFVFNGNLTRFFTKYSPEQHNNQQFGNVYLTIRNRQVRLIDSSNRLLLSFDIHTTRELEQWKNRVNEPSVDNLDKEIILLFSTKYYNSYSTNNLNISKEGYLISFLGSNQNFKNIQVDFSFENYGNNNDIDINKTSIRYSKNGIKYYWNCVSN